MDEGHTRANFPQTCWTLVQQAHSSSDRNQALALEELCRTYWPPVYSYFRSQGRPPHEAEDLTQGFFADIVRREDFGATGKEKGKLRTFLLACAKNYLRNDWNRQRRAKRGGGAEILPLLDEAEDHYSTALADTLTPEQLFDRQWVVTLMRTVLEDLSNTYTQEGKADLFLYLRPHLTTDEERLSQRDIAERLEVRENTINVAMHRLKKRYKEALHAEIAHTLLEGDDVEAELKSLFSAFG